jgi:hypothetical protein
MDNRLIMRLDQRLGARRPGYQAGLRPGVSDLSAAEPISLGEI